MTRDRSLDRAKALGDGTRATIHRLLTEAEGPLTISDLAGLVQIHRTAVGQHLQILRDAGLVERSAAPPTGRGRPGFAYRAVDPDPYRSLARWLADAVRTGRSARDTGQSVALEQRPTGPDPVAVVIEAATRIGFDPVRRPSGHAASADDVDVVLRTCPFAELAAVDPATVCDLHLGIVEGLVASVGGARVVGLRVNDPHRGGCRITLRRTA